MSLPSFYQTKKEPEKDPVKVYFAGKMDGWREGLGRVKNNHFGLFSHAVIEQTINRNHTKKVESYFFEWPELPELWTRWENIHFVGPYRFSCTMSDDSQKATFVYGGPHSSRDRIFHGSPRFSKKRDWFDDPECEFDELITDGYIEFGTLFEELNIEEVWRLNIDAINRCDLFVAYLSEETCFGTLAEIGYAHGIGKRVVIFKDSKVSVDFSIFAEQFSRQDPIWELNEGKRFDEVFEEFLIENGFIQPAASEHVYVMRLGDTQHYKIGRTTRDPTEREKELNGTKAPYDVNLVCQIKTNDCAKLEAFFHEKYKETRGRGEWFNLTPHQIFELVAAAKISEKEAIDCSKLPLNLLGTLRLESK